MLKKKKLKADELPEMVKKAKVLGVDIDSLHFTYDPVMVFYKRLKEAIREKEGRPKL